MRKPYNTTAVAGRFAVCAASAVLAACAATTGSMTGTDFAGPERDAQAYAEAGDLAAAVTVYAELYMQAAGSQRARYAIAAAELEIDAGKPAAARDWLLRAEADAAPDQAPWLIELTAELALADGHAGMALDQLDQLDQLGGDLDNALSLRTMATRGRALFALGRVEQAVRMLVERDLWLDSDRDILANHQIIWDGLRSQAATRPVVASGDPVVDGWLALLPVAVASRSNPYALSEGLDQWFTTHPNHPAVQLLLPALREQDRLAQTYPTQIALLLPLRSLRDRAAAIRDGFLAAHLRNPNGAATRIRIYDTDELGSQQAYLQAQLDGADFVVGPLLKPAVEQVAASAGFVPTLALNTVDTTLALPANFFQFGLAPEDEAVEAARHAVDNGATTAVALFPNSDWGLRVFASFEHEFARLGGHVLESRAYDGGTQDFSLAITTLLNLNDSSQRRQRLAANLGIALEFEPRRRQDVDMIFFAAEPRAARLLAPQFRFHFAGDLPTYATSEIYDAAAGADPDLNGVIFADTPWLLAPDTAAVELKGTLERFWPQRTTRWLKLYGLGYDAYRLIPTLVNGSGGFLSLAGMSGELWLDTTGRVHRRLPIAQFVNGRPVRLEPANDAEGVVDRPILSQR